jgi:hypothetical protein
MDAAHRQIVPVSEFRALERNARPNPRVTRGLSRLDSLYARPRIGELIAEVRVDEDTEDPLVSELGELDVVTARPDGVFTLVLYEEPQYLNVFDANGNLLNSLSYMRSRSEAFKETHWQRNESYYSPTVWWCVRECRVSPTGWLLRASGYFADGEFDVDVIRHPRRRLRSVSEADYLFLADWDLSKITPIGSMASPGSYERDILESPIEVYSYDDLAEFSNFGPYDSGVIVTNMKSGFSVILPEIGSILFTGDLGGPYIYPIHMSDCVLAVPAHDQTVVRRIHLKDTFAEIVDEWSVGSEIQALAAHGDLLLVALDHSCNDDGWQHTSIEAYSEGWLVGAMVLDPFMYGNDLTADTSQFAVSTDSGIAVIRGGTASEWQSLPFVNSFSYSQR